MNKSQLRKANQTKLKHINSQASETRISERKDMHKHKVQNAESEPSKKKKKKHSSNSWLKTWVAIQSYKFKAIGKEFQDYKENQFIVSGQ